MPTQHPRSPRGESALAGALSAQRDASLKGFDWQDPRDPLEKVREEAEEVGSLLASPEAALGDEADGDHAAALESADRLREEIGDLLFAVVNVARLAGVDPRAALAFATAKFERRFAEVERLARRRSLPMPGTPLADLDRIWDDVKADGRG